MVGFDFGAELGMAFHVLQKGYPFSHARCLNAAGRRGIKVVSDKIKGGYIWIPGAIYILTETVGYYVCFMNLARCVLHLVSVFYRKRRKSHSRGYSYFGRKIAVGGIVECD